MRLNPGLTERGTVVELARTPFPQQFVQQTALQRFRGLEDGPGELPHFAVRFAHERLSNKAPGAEERARIAFKAGFWARIAIDTNTSYSQVQAQGFRNNHWIVLRSGDSLPFRTTTRRDFEGLADLSDPLLVFAVFDSLAEAEVFCLGASSEVPALKTC